MPETESVTNRRVQEYLNMMRHTQRSEHTVGTYTLQLRRFIEWLTFSSGDDDLYRVSAADIKDYRQHLLEDRGLKTESVNTIVGVLRAFFGWLHTEGYVVADPTSGVKALEPAERTPRWLSKSERYRVVRTALADDNPRNAVIVALMLAAGLRVSELVQLTPDDVKIGDDGGVIQIKRVGHRRLVPVTKDLRQQLARYVVSHRTFSPWLLSSERGEQLTARGIQHVVTDIGRKANVPGLTPYVLRHTFTHDLVNSKVPLVHIAALLGLSYSRIDRLKAYRDAKPS